MLALNETHMKTIPLTKGYSAIVDDEDYEELSKHRWYWNNGYACRRNGGNSSTTIVEYMHRRLLPPLTGKEIDHVNRNRLDNRRVNLRTCTRSQNMANKRHFKNNTLGYKGIFDLKQYRLRYYASLKVNGKQALIGGFDSPRTAALARDLWARDLYGDFADLNFTPIDTKAA